MFTKEHYYKTYNIRLLFPDIIGIELSRGSGKNTVIPAEICHITPGQRYTRKLPQQMTSMMVDFSKFRPDKRLEMIIGHKGDRAQPPVSPSSKLWLINHFLLDTRVCYLAVYPGFRDANIGETHYSRRFTS